MHTTSFFHYYDAQVIGNAALGQVVSFDSLVWNGAGQERFSSQIKLRPDAVLLPPKIESSEVFDLDLDKGMTEYDWSRKAEQLFGLPSTLHIGIGNTSTLDNFIRFALYRSLSSLPHTDIGAGYHALDLLTLLRALALLRPQDTPLGFDPEWPETRVRAFVFGLHPWDSHADVVRELFEQIVRANPRFAGYAINHSATKQIESRLGLVDGQIESLSSLKPVFICHETLAAPKRWGIYLAMGTDPQYPNIVYVVDLQADLTSLTEDAGLNVGKFIRSTADQIDRPVMRLNINRLPFVSPLGVLEPETVKRLRIDLRTVAHNVSLLQSQQEVCLSLLELSMGADVSLNADPDYQLYGSEYLEADRALLREMHVHPMHEWAAFLEKAHDVRIKELGIRLISRFAPALLSEGELREWRAHCADRLIRRIPPDRIEAIRKYCDGMMMAAGYPMGMRSAARHWLATTETGNERCVEI